MRWDENDRLSWDYRKIAGQMRRYCGIEDISRLFRRMIFNILIRNTDDHPRNHGFLVNPDGLSISPAYDIVPSPAQAGVNTDFNLAMVIGERGREASLENALSQSSQFGLTPQNAREIAAQLLEYAGNWRNVFEECGVSGRDIDLLAPSFARCDDEVL